MRLPPIIRDIVASRWRKKIQQQIYGHGMGRHQAEEIFALGKQDIDALAAYLGHKPYFLGDRPTALDASAFGLLINIRGCPIESPFKEYALTKENLTNYNARIMRDFYQDMVIV